MTSGPSFTSTFPVLGPPKIEGQWVPRGSEVHGPSCYKPGGSEGMNRSREVPKCSCQSQVARSSEGMESIPRGSEVKVPFMKRSKVPKRSFCMHGTLGFASF